MSIPSPPSDPSGPRCETCGLPTSTLVLSGLCASCLLNQALPSSKLRVGAYELEQELAQGGSGLVYLARQPSSRKAVALKLARADIADRASVRAVFRAEAEAGRVLEHPHIGSVLESGEHGELPYLVMPLFDGGTLEDDENRRRYRTASSALELISKIAAAVEFAHSRGILHCDLKASNILFNAEDQPKVCDFGLARPSDGTRAKVGGGTRGWMSPEQVQREPLTTASDVFALGVLLFWLIRGELPFGNGDDFDHRVQHQELEPLGPWRPELDWGLYAICQRALQKRARDRYGTAQELVKDLDRLREYRPPFAHRTPLPGQIWHRVQAHGAAQFVVALLLSLTAVTTSLTAQRQRAELRNTVLDMNAYAASGQAAQILYRLRDYAEQIEQSATDPAVIAIAESTSRADRTAPVPVDNPCADERALANPEPLRSIARGFDSMLVLNRWGCPRARVSAEPPSADYVNERFDWRDYFHGAEQAALRGDVSSMVRRAYRSSISQHIKFAVSAPIFRDGIWLGVLSGSITSASTLNRAYKSMESDERMTVLVGAFEGEGSAAESPTASDFAYLVHPKLRFGDKVMLDRKHTALLERAFRSDTGRQFELSTKLPLPLADYLDPLLGGRWLAVFAAVGNTGYFVVVQTRDEAATRPANIIVRTGYALALSSAVVWIAFSVFASWTARRRRSMTAVHSHENAEPPAGAH